MSYKLIRKVYKHETKIVHTSTVILLGSYARGCLIIILK